MMGGLVSRRTSFRPEFVAIAAFLGLSAFQYLSIATQITDERERFARTQLTNVESGLLLVILVAVTFSTRSRRLLVAALVPGIVIASIAAIASLSPAILGALPIGGLLPSQDISARGTGIFLNPNYMGQAVAMAVLLLGTARRLDLPLGLSRRPWLGALPPLLALGASFSRGAAVAFVSGVVALYWSRGRRMFIGAALGGVVVIVVGYPILLGVRHSLTFGPDIAASEEAQQVSDGSRIAAARAGFRLFLSRPLTGVGYGQFHYESPGYLGASPITYAHNSYIQIAAEQGLVGIAAFLLALLALYLALSARADAYAITARAMLVAFAVGSLFAEPVTSYQTSAILWLVVGTALVQVAPTVSAGPAGEVDDWHTVTQRWVATPAT
jgi:O-antigen ligase